MDPLAKVRLGRTDVRVTRLGLGTGPLGGWPSGIDENVGLATIATAYGQGVRYFDTAPLYGYGQAEEWLGRALVAYPRDDHVISTKVGRLLTEGADAVPFFRGTNRSLHPVWDFSYDGVKRSLEASLDRMRISRVDVALIHDADDHLDEALTGAYAALADLRRQGLIGAVGAGMNRVRPLAYLLERAELDCVLIAGRFTLLDQSAAAELLPLAQSRGTSVIVGGVYNSGILADPTARATYDYRAAPPEMLRRARRLADACEAKGVPLRAAALQFPFTHSSVAAIVVGSRGPAEVKENLELLRTRIPPAFWEELRGLSVLGPSEPQRLQPGS